MIPSEIAADQAGARARSGYSVDNLDVNCRNVVDVTRNFAPHLVARTVLRPVEHAAAAGERVRGKPTVEAY